MQHSHLLRATVCAASLLLGGTAFAQGGGHGGGHGGGGHGGGFGGGHSGGGGHGFNGGFAGGHGSSARAFSSGGNGGWNRGGWNGGHGSGGGWGYPGYGYGYGYDNPYDSAYGYDYGDPDYAYSQPDNGYDSGYNYGPGVYSQQGYQNVAPDNGQQVGQLGDYCRSPVKSCQLYQPANAGADCSCRNGNTRAQGIVSQ
jgi:hypothetical protein